MHLKTLQTDGKSDINETYYVDNRQRIWLKTTDHTFVRPSRYDIYSHICKINNIRPKTQIYYSYSTLNSTAKLVIK